MSSVKYFIFCLMIVASSSYGITFPMAEEIERHRQASDAYIQKTFCNPTGAFTQGKIDGKNPSAVLKKSYLNYSCAGFDNNDLYNHYVKGFYYGRMFV